MHLNPCFRTIGQLAESDEKLLESHFGKIGNVLWAFANGWDEDPVCKEGYEAPVKSIGNSTTTPRDLENDLDVWIIQIALAESVAARLRKHGFAISYSSVFRHKANLTLEAAISCLYNFLD